MAEALNPLLYRRLKKLFRTVKISNLKQTFLAKRSRNILTDAPRLEYIHTGEYYQVCCPYCTDTKFRLYVNHMYGQKDAFGRRMSFLAVCYNDTACMNYPENREDFWDKMSAMDSDLEVARILPGDNRPPEERVVDWPGPCMRLTKLRDSHPAVEYVNSRGFSPEYLTKYFDVRYCLSSNYFLAMNRLIIPVHQRGELRGWQARYVGELPWKNKAKKKGLPPKYFTLPGMPRQSLIYNFDRAREYETGIVVEGPADTWAFGMMSMCTFGSTMTTWQRKRFLSIFRRRTGVLLYDPEAFDTRPVQELIAYLTRRMPGRFAAVKLPDDTDPGKFGRGGRAFLRDYVHDKAKEQGVKVSYKKVA